MELVGSLSNPAVLAKLDALTTCRREALAHGEPRLHPASRPPARAGEIVETIVVVLAECNGSMRVAEIHRYVEQRLGRRVNRKSVKACLSEWALASRPRFQRTGYGRYRLR